MNPTLAQIQQEIQQLSSRKNDLGYALQVNAGNPAVTQQITAELNQISARINELYQYGQMLENTQHVPQQQIHQSYQQQMIPSQTQQPAYQPQQMYQNTSFYPNVNNNKPVHSIESKHQGKSNRYNKKVGEECFVTPEVSVETPTPVVVDEITPMPIPGYEYKFVTTEGITLEKEVHGGYYKYIVKGEPVYRNLKIVNVGNELEELKNSSKVEDYTTLLPILYLDKKGTVLTYETKEVAKAITSKDLSLTLGDILDKVEQKTGVEKVIEIAKYIYKGIEESMGIEATYYTLLDELLTMRVNKINHNVANLDITIESFTDDIEELLTSYLDENIPDTDIKNNIRENTINLFTNISEEVLNSFDDFKVMGVGFDTVIYYCSNMVLNKLVKIEDDDTYKIDKAANPELYKLVIEHKEQIQYIITNTGIKYEIYYNIYRDSHTIKKV